MSKTICPKCGKPKKPWFNLCWNCSEDEKQKPVCEVCGKEVPEGHTLCKTHWLEKQEQKKKLNQIDYVKTTKEKEFHERYQGKYRFNQIMFKSKSELIIYLFLKQNGLQALYEETITLEENPYHPDFVIVKGEDTIILEHFGMDDKQYNNIVAEKKKKYEKLCKEHKHFHFIWTTENDLGNLKVRLGEKLNKTPLKTPMWK